MNVCFLYNQRRKWMVLIDVLHLFFFFCLVSDRRPPKRKLSSEGLLEFGFYEHYTICPHLPRHPANPSWASPTGPWLWDCEGREAGQGVLAGPRRTKFDVSSLSGYCACRHGTARRLHVPPCRSPQTYKAISWIFLEITPALQEH